MVFIVSQFQGVGLQNLRIARNKQNPDLTTIAKKIQICIWIEAGVYHSLSKLQCNVNSNMCEKHDTLAR